MITIVDYGLGNVRAFVNIFRLLNVPVAVACTASELASAQRVILPGVGAFDWAMTKLNESGMRDCLDDMVLNRGCPVLGVCVGMQMMARRSDEGSLPGLAWLDAEVKRFDDAAFTQRTHLPHMGWNDVQPRNGTILFRDMPTPRFYFLHSYFIAAKDADIAATTDYNGTFASAVQAGNICGTQFHPEKSHHWGTQLLKNFAAI